MSGAFESYAVADGHDGVINGIRMAGHVKTCREWDQLFILRMGIFTWYKTIQCLYYYTYTTSSSQSQTQTPLSLSLFLLSSTLFPLIYLLGLLLLLYFGSNYTNNKNISPPLYRIYFPL